MVSKLYWPERSRVPEPAILGMAREAGKGNRHIDGHLPDLIYTHDFHQYSTTRIRILLGMKENDERVLRLIVFRRLYPITDLVGAEFWEAFWECFRCHLHLWRSGIRHCDISVSNLMYDKATNCGVLNDFDLAQLRDHPCSNRTEWTGTMPFMALDLFWKAARDGKVEREYRHDAESFAWVLLWICCTYKDGKELPKRPLEFIQHDPGTTYEKKLTFRAYVEDYDVGPTASYDRKFYDAACSVLRKYVTRHHNAGCRGYSRIGEKIAEPNLLELLPDEPAAIEAELQLYRNGVASAGLYVDL
ncbi:hypothetical protein BD779DRAFT_110091 [Infundibulicybe gibba]|nr:hypothetical protein BD779DRAFT_110091 [Infundibulicybe gibba]